MSAAAVVVTATAAGSVAPASAAEPAVVLVVGDSVMAGMLSDARAALSASFPSTVDAAVCRRLGTTSCPYQGATPLNALQVVQSLGSSHRFALVIGAGYNDTTVTTAVPLLLAAYSGPILWVNYREAGVLSARYAAMNVQLATLAAQSNGRLRILDWRTLSANQTAWTGTDGVHLSAEGGRQMARLIIRGLTAQRNERSAGFGRSTQPRTASGGVGPQAARFRRNQWTKEQLDCYSS